MRRLLVITNAAAGSADESAVSCAVAVLEEVAEVTVTATSSPDDLAAVLAGLGDREVVVAGGDGSLHAVVAALVDGETVPRTPIGLIPLGTGNDFARGAGIPLDPAEAASVIASGRSKPIDLLVDESGEIVVNAVHAGVGAEAGRRAQAWKERLGRTGYLIGALIAGLAGRGTYLKVLVDGAAVADGRRRVLQVAVGNGSRVGGGTALLPTARPDDGRADVVVSFAASIWRRFGYAIQLRRRDHIRRDDVVTCRGREVEVRGERFFVNADGEIHGPVRFARWTIRPRALTMYIPVGIAATSTDDGG